MGIMYGLYGKEADILRFYYREEAMRRIPTRDVTIYLSSAGHIPVGFHNVYYIWRDMESEQFIIQKEELSGIQWMNLEECIGKVEKNERKHCIAMEEFQMLVKTLKEQEKAL